MKRFLIMLVVIAVVVLAGGVGLGYYRGWFTVAVDQDKIRADEEKVVKKVDQVVHPDPAKATTPGEKSK